MSEKLKPCPFCAGEAKYLMPTSDLHTVQCIHCAIGTPYSSSKEKAIAAWNRRAEPDMVNPITENAPLTLDELRTMNGCPVWCIDHQGNGKWALVYAADEVCTDADFGDWEFYCYGWTDSDVGWLAYRTKPKEEKE